jgi:phospholipid/cholesterol/gamma-HCH transport system substrate-binding protein
MNSKRTKLYVGLFVTGGLIILISGLIWLGASRYFEKGYMVVAYFNESVQGLKTNAAVKYRGVPVGRVVSIRLAPDNRLVEVVMKLDPECRLQDKTEVLAAQLKITGITGSMFIELDRKDTLDIRTRSFSLDFEPEYPVIDTIPSDIKQFMEQVNQTLDQLNALEIENISKRTISIMENLNRILQDQKIKQIFSDAQQLFSNLNSLTGQPQWQSILTSLNQSGTRLNQVLDQASTSLETLGRILNDTGAILEENRPTLRAAIKEFKATGTQAHQLMLDSQKTVRSGKTSLQNLYRQLSTISRKLDQASETLNDALERIRQQPSQLLFSNPPKPRKVE